MKTRSGSVSDGPESQQAAEVSQLLLAGCGQQCVPQPVGFCPTGSGNGGADKPCFFRWQPNRKNNCKTFLREAGPTHFRFHVEAQFCLRKLLTVCSVSFTKV